MSLVKENLTTNAQNFTTNWVDLGSEIPIETFFNLGIWLDIDINDTVDARIRAVVRHATGGSDYVLPIKTETATVVNVEDEYFEFTTDEDKKRLIGFTLDKIIPYIQIQIQCETVGASAGQILSSKYTLC